MSIKILLIVHPTRSEQKKMYFVSKHELNALRRVTFTVFIDF